MTEVGTLQPWPTFILNYGVVLLSPCLTKLYKCVVEIHHGCGLCKRPPAPILTPHVTHTNHQWVVVGQNGNMLGDVWYRSWCDPVTEGLLLHTTNALMWKKYFWYRCKYWVCSRAAGQEAQYHLDKFPVCHLAHTQSNTINTQIPISCFT